MRIFVAGATGVIGLKLVPLLVNMGHTVAGMTRNVSKVTILRNIGAEPFVCDIYDQDSIEKALLKFEPDLIINELTDLPDNVDNMAAYTERNNRIRTVGIRNLIKAATKANSPRLLVQSVAWELPGAGVEAVRFLEKSVLEYGGTVLRYGRLYGPGTFYVNDTPPSPRVHIEEAARKTAKFLYTTDKFVKIED